MTADAAHPFLTEDASTRLTSVSGVESRLKTLTRLDLQQKLGGAAVLIGVVVLAVGWAGISGTTRTVDQLSYLFSGGVGGAALLAVGLILFVAHEHAADRRSLVELQDRLTELEAGLAGEFDALHHDLQSLAGDGRARAART